MRRPEQSETLHGTRNGQLLVAAGLRDAYGLTEREAATAALLATGLPPSRIAERLGISASTCEKHLAAVRTKVRADSTTECVAILAREAARGDLGPPAWPANTRAQAPDPTRATPRLAERLRGADDLEDAIHILRVELAEEGVGALCYVFLPQNVASLRRAAWVERWDAPAPVVEAYRAAGGLPASPLSARLLAEPDRPVVVHGTDADAIERESGLRFPLPILCACRDAGLRHSLAFGTPFGCGFVAATMFFHRDPRGADGRELGERLGRLRAALMLAHGSVFDFGLLARTLGLTERERDALSLLAVGHERSEVAGALGCGDRSVSKVLQSARSKLDAATNAEAIARALAMNALVFL
ncbi:MAG: LuxR C-terminal-related transcriptional regulator [Proteobacteria bacterium]|nr:LuxR C-terminal-related transcriptional regulator [Pseudomonadota bacterium]